MEVSPYIPLAVLALAIVAFNSLWPSRRKWISSRRKRLNRTLASRSRTFVHGAQGTVRLTGRVRPIGGLLHAPFSGRPCVAYEVVVDEPAGRGWRRLVELWDAHPFLLADESGDARIDTSGPYLISLNYDRDGDTSGCKYPDTHQGLASLLAAADVWPTKWLGGWRRFRYAEGVLEEGELVSVSAAGVLEVDPMGERAGPRSPPQRLVLRGTEAVPLLIGEEKDASSHDS